MPDSEGWLQHLRTKDWIYWIAINEIIGGILGLALMIFGLAASISAYTIFLSQQSLSFSNMINLAASIIFMILYAISLAAGWFLKEGDPRGLTASLFIQIAQLFRLTIPGILTYQFTSGFSLPLDFGFGSTGFNFNISGSFSSTSFSLSPEENMYLIGTNLIAIFSINQLLKMKRLSLHTTDGSSITDESGIVDEN
ncbi:MAG TPA: hypothetical protein PLW21_08375 [Methanothrix sp.]|nr:hypothetical protein [Methanothrix sp.]